MSNAWIAGSPASIEAAIAEAARLLATSRLAVVAGLGTDIAGARAALALARQIGGVIDHMHGEALLRDLDAAREAGMIVTTPNEARLRADVVLTVGSGLHARPDLARMLLAPPAAPEIGPGARRRVFWLCPGRRAGDAAKQDAEIRTIGHGPAELPALLAALRARVAGRPVSRISGAAKTVDALAQDLKAARFGVAVWSAAEIDAMTLEMLAGLIDDLNARTRFAGLPLWPEDNGVGVIETCGWTLGLPVRTGFGRARPEHDPWQFDATRLIESGEADSAVWISAYGDARPPWRRSVPTVAITATEADFAPPAQVHIQVGRPGRDHDAVEHLPMTGALAAATARRPGAALSVAQALTRIAAAVPGGRHADAH